MVANKSSALLSSYMSTNYSNNLSQNSSRSRRKTKTRKKTRHESDDHNSSDDKSSKSSDESLHSNVKSNDRSNRFVKNKSFKSNLSESESEDDSDSNLSASDTNEKCEFSIVKEDNDSTTGTLKLRIATRRTNSVPNKKTEIDHPLPKRQLSVIEAVSGVVREGTDDGADHGLDCQCWIHAGKGKRQPIPLKINRKHRHRRKRNDSSYDSSRSRSQSHSRSRSNSRSARSSSNCSSRSCSTSSSHSSYSSSHSSSSCGSYSCSTSGSSSGSSSSSSVSGDSDSSDSDIDCKRKTNRSLNSKNSKQSKDLSMNEIYINRSEDSSNGLRINCQQNVMPSTPLSQPSSVSCESSCYSPAISINSPLNSLYAHKKRDPAEERQRLRSYRIPHLQNRDRATNSGSSSNTQNSKTPATATVAVQVQTDTEDVVTMNSKSKAQSSSKSKSVGTESVSASNGKKQLKNKNKKSKKEKSDKSVKSHDNKRSKSQTKTKKSKSKKSQSISTDTGLALGSNDMSEPAMAQLTVETNSKNNFSDSLYADVNRVINEMSLNENCSVINNDEKITHFLQSVPHLNDTNHPNSSLESLHHEKASPDSGIQSQGESPHRHHSVSDNEVQGIGAASTSRSTAISQQNSRSVNTRKKQKTKSSKTKSDTNSKKSLINSSALQTNDAKSDNQTDFQVNAVKSIEHLIPGVNLVPQTSSAMTSNSSNLAQLTEIFLNNSNPNEATIVPNFDMRVPLNFMPIMGRNLMPYPRCQPILGHLPFMNPPKREDDFELLFRSIKEQISQFPNNENEDLDFDQFNGPNSNDWRHSHHNNQILSYQSAADSSAGNQRQKKSKSTESSANRKRNNRKNKSEVTEEKIENANLQNKHTVSSSERKSRSKTKKTQNKSNETDESKTDKQISSSLTTESIHKPESIEAEKRIESELMRIVSNDYKTMKSQKSQKSSHTSEVTTETVKLDTQTQNVPQMPQMTPSTTTLSSSSRKHHKRKHKKHKSRSKHKESAVEPNPEFLSLMENLSKSFKLLKVSKRLASGANDSKSRPQLPTIFQFINFLKNIKIAKKHHLEHSIATSSHSTDSPKMSTNKKPSKKKVTNSMNQTEQSVTEKKKVEKKSEMTCNVMTSANGVTGANEQRLPLKKRHHRHIESKQNSQSAVNTSQLSNSSNMASNYFHSSPNHTNSSSDIKTTSSSNLDNHSNGSTGDMIESKKKTLSSHPNVSSPGVQPKTKRSTTHVSPKTNALTDSEGLSKDLSNVSKFESSVSKKSNSYKSSKSESNASKVKKSLNCAKGSNESQVVHSSADKQNGILSDENQMAIWDSAGTAASPLNALPALHNSKATASDRLSLSAQPIACGSVKAQNSIDQTIEQCIRKYTIGSPNTGSDHSDSDCDKQVVKKKKVDTKTDKRSEFKEKSSKLPLSSVSNERLSESVLSGVCVTVSVANSGDASADMRRARANSAKDKTCTKAGAPNTTRSTTSASVKSPNRKGSQIEPKTAKRDLKSGDATNKPSQTQTQDSSGSATNAKVSANDNKGAKRKRTFNKTGFPQPRKKARTEASGQQKQNTTKLVTNTVNGKRPHSALGELTDSVRQKKELSSNDTNCKSSQPSNRSNRCRPSDRSIGDSSKTLKVNNDVNNANKTKSVKTRTTSESKSKLTQLKTDPVASDKIVELKRKPIRSERRMSKASIDSVSSSEAYMSETTQQSSATDTPIYIVTEPTNKSVINSNKNVMRIKPFQRSIPYKKYVKFGKYSEDSKCEKVMTSIESDDKLSDSQSSQMSATEDESKVCQKLMALPEVDFDMTENYNLPYDIWYQLRKSSDSKNHTCYVRIKQNLFHDVKPTSKYQAQSCNCEPPLVNGSKGCGHNCLNRLSYLECSPQSCPVGDLCDNQRMQKHDWSPGLQRIMTAERGWGIRTIEAIKAGDFILEYIGEVVSEKEFKTRMAERYQNDQHHYCLNLDSGMVIDGYRKANEGRFVNHSCEPNCEMQKWSVNGYYRVGLFALRDIMPNEELSYDYNFDNFNLETQQVCRCGSAKCRGYIGVRSQKVSNNSSKDKCDKNESNLKEVSVQKENNHRSRRKDVNQTKSGTASQNKTQSLRKSSISEKMKPLSHQTSCYILKRRLFLLRNYEKLRRIRNNQNDKKVSVGYGSEDFVRGKEAKTESSKDLINVLMTLNSRSVRTRGLTKAESNEELTRTAKLVPIFTEVCQSMINKQMTLSLKTETSADKPVTDAKPCVVSMPRRKSIEKQPNRIDLSDIQSQIKSGSFKSPQTFEETFIKALTQPSSDNNESSSSDQIEFFSQMKEEFHKLMSEKKPFIEDIMSSDNNSICGEQTTDSTESKEIKKSESSDSLSNMSNNSIPHSNQLIFVNEVKTALGGENGDQNKMKHEKQEEEVIRCICGILKEDGQMIQCDECEVYLQRSN